MEEIFCLKEKSQSEHSWTQVSQNPPNQNKKTPAHTKPDQGENDRTMRDRPLVVTSRPRNEESRASAPVRDLFDKTLKTRNTPEFL